MNNPDKNLVIVGIGASAGGLEALEILLPKLPVGNGFAYIIAQHLHPDKQSLLRTLLAKKTPLKVVDAKHNSVPKAGTIYISKPGRDISLTKNCYIQLHRVGQTKPPHPSIDRLFLSLAQVAEQNELMVAGIILSGTGSDGSLGLRAIKTAGGMTMAQTPESAAHSGMPMSAIEASQLDHVLEPAKLGSMIKRLSQQGAISADLSDAGASSLEDLLHQIEQHKGIDFSLYKRTTLLRRIQCRMTALHLKQQQDYLRYIEDNAEEIDILFQELLIGVTSFKRDPAAFDALSHHLSLYIKKQEKTPLRIWVPGCSTGEEAYTLAIVLAELMQPAPCKNNLSIFATDIDEVSLDIARKGHYPVISLEQLPQSLVKRYFTISNDRYQISRNLRECVVFSRHDVLRDPPFVNMDIISCRNLLIYFTSKAQKQLMTLFHYALKPRGLLFLGKSESVSGNKNYFSTVDKQARIYSATALAKQPWNSSRTLAKPTARASLAQYVVEKSVHQLSLEERIQRIAGSLILPDCLVIDSDMNIVFKHGEIPWLQMPAGFASLNLFNLLPVEMSMELRAAIYTALHQQEAVNTRFVPAPVKQEHDFNLRMRVIPYRDEQNEQLILIYFEVLEAASLAAMFANIQDFEDSHPLKIELDRTRGQMQALIEELETSNEELQSLNEEMQASNEELQSSTEELETSNEELQATHEELQSAYNELQRQNDINNEQRIQLLHGNARYESLHQSMHDGMIISDLDGHVIEANVAFCKLTGYTSDEITGMHWMTYTPKEWHQLTRRNLRQTIKQSEQTAPYEKEFLCKDGSQFPAEVKNYLLHDENNQPVAFGCILRDLRAEKAAKAELEHSESLYRKTFELATAGIVHINEQGEVSRHNLAFSQILGLPEGWTQQHQLTDFIHSDDRQHFHEVVAQLFAGQAVAEAFMLRLIHANDEVLICRVNGALFKLNDDTTGVVLVVENLSEIIVQQDSIREAASVFDAMSEGMMITDADAVIQRVNPGFCQITGYRQEDVVGKPASVLKSGQHDNGFYQTIARDLNNRQHWRGEIINQRKNGDLYNALLDISVLRDDGGKVNKYIGLIADISSFKRTEELVQHMAYHDTLTDLANRELLKDRLTMALERAHRHHLKVAVMFLDLDRFKVINDGLGHDVGDKLLVQVAGRLNLAVRRDDTVARLGGDEFIVIAADLVNIQSINLITHKLVDAFKKPFVIAEHELKLSTSIGISLYPEDGNDIDGLMRIADTAMYQAKSAGGGQYRFATPELANEAFEKLLVEAELNRALDQNELYLVYQPQMDMATREIIGFEALLRWNHSKLGPVSPLKFIPIAEESDLICDIGSFVLHEACSRARHWHDKFGFTGRISVNVSSKQLKPEQFVLELDNVIKDSGLPAEQLELEITEHSLMSLNTHTTKMLNAISDLGILIAIDDFGTGYSSLAYLKGLPVSQLKIDQSFVREIPQDRDDMEITRAIISMAHALRLEVVAEGVETEEQLTFLCEHKCDLVQGYHFHQPLSLEAVEKILAK